MALGITLPEILTSLLQMGVSANAPYSAAKAQTYATKDLFNNIGTYTGLANAANPSTTSAYYTLDSNGNKVWHSPAAGTVLSRIKATTDPNYLAQTLAKQTDGAKTSVKNVQPSLLNSMTGLGFNL